MEHDSIALIKEMANGSREAFRQFYQKHASLAYTFAMRILQSPSDSEDLLQEVFMQVWRQASRYSKERGNPEAWLITITRSRAIDKVRSKRRADKGVQKVEDHVKTATEASESSVASKSLAKLTVSGALTELNAEQKEVVELAYFDGYTQTEISEKLGIPLGTVKTRVRSALKKLRGVLTTKESETN